MSTLVNILISVIVLNLVLTFVIDYTDKKIKK